jgi:hypothetical protein
MTLMVLARAWRWRMYASLGMAVIVPLALLASLALLALNGGIPGLGSLRQAVAGPSASVVAGPRLGGSLTGSRATALLGSLSGVAARGAPATGVASPAVLGGGGATGTARRGSGGGGAGGISPGGGRSGSGGGPGRYPGSSQPPGKQPSPGPTAVDRVVNTVTPVTSGLPAPVGPAVTKTLKSGGSVADRILHHLPGQ